MQSTDLEAGGFKRFATKYRNEFGLVIATILVFGITFAFDPSLRYSLQDFQRSVQLLSKDIALLGMFALGAGIVIIVGGIDLSSGSMIAFSASVCSLVMYALSPDVGGDRATLLLHSGWIAFAISMAILAGVLIGTFHAWLITVIGLPPFVATLASLVGLRSIARMMNEAGTKSIDGGQGTVQITIETEAFLKLDTWWIPPTVFLLMSFGLWILLSKTVIGRHLLAMGGNEEAAKLSGIRTDRLKWLAYVIGATTASVAGVFYAASSATIDPTTLGIGYELNAIAASVVGGCSLAGGIGTISGIVLGVCFLRVVIFSITRLVPGNPDVAEGFVVGLLIVLAVAFNELRNRSNAVTKSFFPGVLGICNILILSFFTGLITQLVVVTDFTSGKAGLYAGLSTLVLLSALKIAEVIRSKKHIDHNRAVAADA